MIINVLSHYDRKKNKQTIKNAWVEPEILDRIRYSAIHSYTVSLSLSLSLSPVYPIELTIVKFRYLHLYLTVIRRKNCQRFPNSFTVLRLISRSYLSTFNFIYSLRPINWYMRYKNNIIIHICTNLSEVQI